VEHPLYLLPPVLELSSANYTFYTILNEADPLPQRLTISNLGGGTLRWNIEENCDWLHVNPTQGSCFINQTFDVTLSTDVSVLTSVGDYRYQLTVSDPCALSSPQTVDVVFAIIPPSDDLWVPYEFDTIQDAIDAAVNGDTIVVADGTYSGPGNRDILIWDKAITVRSQNGPDKCIIDCQGKANENHRGFYFYKDPGSLLDGFTIINGYRITGVGIIFDQSSATVKNCILHNNQAEGDGGAIYCYNGNATIQNCTIINNQAVGDGGAFYITHNSSLFITNSILWNNQPDEIRVSNSGNNHVLATHCLIRNGWPGFGNLDTDPKFADPANGDFHLKSQTGRWNPITQTWIIDPVHSPGIDAGNPNFNFSLEPTPNGLRINIGAYGNTPQASKSLSQPPLFP